MGLELQRLINARQDTHRCNCEDGAQQSSGRDFTKGGVTDGAYLPRNQIATDTSTVAAVSVAVAAAMPQDSSLAEIRPFWTACHF